MRLVAGAFASTLLVVGLEGTLAVTEASMPSIAGTPACAQARPGQAVCLARYMAARPQDAGGLLGGLLGSGGLLGGLGLGSLLGTAPAPAPAPPPTQTPSGPQHGFTAADLRSAYGIAGIGAAGRIVAVVDAMDDPNAESDLGVYRAAMGLTPCTTANGCFRKVDASGGTSYPAPDAGWSKETSLDLEMVSAACSDCRIVLVEAATQDIPVLGAAVNYAASIPGVAAMSLSWGVPEQAQQVGWDQYFNHPGIPIAAAAGDSGFGTVFPSASPYVIAVGGTTLTRDSSARGWSETAWNGTGSGCSSYEPKPAWQTASGCARRATADIAVDADPATGVAVYDSYQAAGWLQAGGTSAGAPFIAALYALAGNAAANAAPGPYLYSHTAAIHDIVSGGNGFLCLGNPMCTARPGWDGPTGLGSPSGLAAF
ncbi:MAG TPA: peptidase S8 [Candidatus Dormibacteraeota bacterium]|nr:peptidase S8 [Candidatus Dormibacteraeota bacterium]